MRLTMRERRAVTRVLIERYRKAGKKEKGRILDELVEVTGYSRCYGAYLLRRYGKRLRKGKLTLAAKLPVKVTRRPRGRTYDVAVVEVLKRVWQIMDYPCGKRLVVMIAEVLPILEQHQEISATPGVRNKLLQISAATIDRLLVPERRRLRLRGRSGTKPGTLLKHQIPIRTFTEWDEQQPGFIEIDLVAHDGGNGSGDFAQTLNATDVATGWTEPQGIQNKAQVWTFDALKAIRRRLPFPLLGIDSDNGGEFINGHLLGYCQEEHITFTRSRPYRKNDSCYVEQKNYTVVRRAVGYARYDTPQLLGLLNELYGHLRLYTNYFQPVMKLLSKERQGAKVKKKYDQPKTPYQRVLGSPTVATKVKRRLKQEYALLNPAQLKREITRLQHKLFKLAAGRADLLNRSPKARVGTAHSRNIHDWIFS
jgi:hypothetical protein